MLSLLLLSRMQVTTLISNPATSGFGQHVGLYAQPVHTLPLGNFCKCSVRI